MNRCVRLLTGAAVAGLAMLLVPEWAAGQNAGSAPSTRGAAGEHLSALLKKPAYRESWNRLIQGQPDAEGWLKDYASRFDGPTTPGETLVLSDGEYLIMTVCQRSNCGPTLFYVLFSPDGSQAWGIQRRTWGLKPGQQEPAVVFGRPDGEKERAIRAFMAAK